MGTTAFAQEVTSDYNALVTSESVYGPGNYDENNYFHFASRDRMSSAGDFYFSLEYTLKSDNFWIKNSGATVAINATGKSDLKVSIIEVGWSGIFPKTHYFTANGTWQTYTFGGLYTGHTYYLVLETSPKGNLVSGIGYIRSSDFGGLA